MTELRLDHQRSREPHTLFHSAGKLLRICVFKAIEAHGVQNVYRRF